jgi:long-subunit acyl-CoA synthetase (AMP-forming)
MPLKLIEQVKDMSTFFGEGYGLSESTVLWISNPIRDHKVGSIGVSVPDNDVRLVSIKDGATEVKRNF